MMGKKVLAAKSGRASCPNAAAGGGIAAKRAKGAKSFLTGLTGFTRLREASVKPAKTKPSGIEWIGDVPEGWGIGRVKNSFYHTKEVVKERAAEFDRLALTLQGVIKRPKEDTNGLQPKEFEGYQVLRKNELVFKLIDLQNISTSRVGRSSYDGIVSPAYIILHSRDNSSTAFACYYFLSMWMHNIFQTLGGDAVRSCLNASDLLNVPLLRPPLPEQRAIADYLDDKCGAIDAAIAEAKKGIEEYKAWKKSLIFEVVTGKRRVGVFNAESKCARDEVVGLPERSEPEGLQGAARRRVAESFSTGLTRFTGLGENLDNPVNPVKTKPSGIPWIGDVPVGWEVCRVKDVAKIKTGNTPDKQYQREYYSTDGGVPWIKAENLGFMSPISQTAEYLTKEGCKQGRIFQPRTVYVCCIASIGKVGYSEIEASCNQQLNALAFNSRMHWKYGFYVTIASEEEYLVRASGNVVKILNSSEQGLMALPLPSIAEQRAIADYLDDKCAAIDKMVAEKEALIADLEAYKKSLIFEVVTGKREVVSTIEVK